MLDLVVDSDQLKGLEPNSAAPPVQEPTERQKAAVERVKRRLDEAAAFIEDDTYSARDKLRCHIKRKHKDMPDDRVESMLPGKKRNIEPKTEYKHTSVVRTR